MYLNGYVCQNCGTLLTSVQSSFMSMDYIHDTIRRRNLPFVPDLYGLLSGAGNLKDGMQNFADLVMEGKTEFEEYHGLLIRILFDTFLGQVYRFEDNFIKWLHDEIPASEVVFKPNTIIQMTSTVMNLPTVRAASQWSYDPLSGNFYTMWSTFRLDYETPYPYICDISPDSSEQTPVWTKESGVYLVANKDYFIDQISLTVLRRIQEYSELVQLDGFTGQLQLSNTIDRLSTRVEDNRLKSSDLYYKWRNR